MKPRLDELLVERKLASTLREARALVMSGAVFSQDQRLAKAGTRVDPDISLEVRPGSRPYVSRGGEKLAGAFKEFGIDPEGWVCVDLGASTGGFTDCLLQNGASRVYAFDVGTGQLDWGLRQDPRVRLRENFNVRHLFPEDVPESVNLLVADLSFISLRLILPRLRLFLPAPSLVLVKPQFEAEREEVEPGGLITSESLRQEIIRRVIDSAREQGFRIRGHAPSVLPGRTGNEEEFLYLGNDG